MDEQNEKEELQTISDEEIIKKTKQKNFRKRIITGAIIVLVLSAVVLIPQLLRAYILVVLFLLFLSIHELLSAYETEGHIHLRTKLFIFGLTILLFLSSGGILLLSFQNITEYEDILAIIQEKDFLLIVSLFVTLGILALPITDRTFDSKRIGQVFSLVFYLGLGFSSLIFLRFIGIRFIIYAFLITMLTDTFAYLIGSKFGRHKMSPILSPKKSWEGAIGGSLVTTIICSVYAISYGYIFVPGTWIGNIVNASGNRTLLSNFSVLGDSHIALQAVILFFITLIGTILSQVGDLVASSIKRSYNLKDFGHIFPGHGGVLDRFDSMLYVSMFLSAVFLFINRILPLIPIIK
jgi:phosphatidate cytidylyltransferase